MHHLHLPLLRRLAQSVPPLPSLVPFADVPDAVYSLDRRQASKFKPTPTPSRQTSKSARPHRPAVVTTGLGDTIPVVLETRDSSFLGAGEGVKVEREVVAHVDQGSTPGDTVEVRPFPFVSIGPWKRD